MVAPLEFMAAIGMLYHNFGMPLPERKSNIAELKGTALQAFANHAIPDTETEKILKIVTGFDKEAGITDDFWKTLECGFE